MEIKERISRRKSAALFEAAKKMFPGGVHSPVRAFKSVIGPPLFIEWGEGARIVDADGNNYLDFCCSWGPLILGHAHPEVIAEVLETVKRGTSFGAPNELGNRLGRLILENHRYVQMLRFVSSGTEAVMSALRLARGVTGRNKILKFEGCYHGHVDALLVRAGSGLATFGTSTSAGVPQSVIEDTIVLPLDDTERLETAFQTHGQELACAIIEPVPANNGLLLQDGEFLRLLRHLCTEHGALLIFDEVISGFRVGFEGAAGHYDIPPDIVTFGKIIGGGMPVGAYGASAQIMRHVAPEGPVYQAGTLSANPVAMAAGWATLRKLLEPGLYASLEEKTHRLASQIDSHARAKGYPLRVPHIASIFWLSFSEKPIRRADQIDAAGMEKFKTLHHELLQRGVYLGPSGYEVGFVSTAHSDSDLDFAAEQICAALDSTFSS